MRKIKEKIINNAGESIGEVLVALLISGLALLMLAGAIASSSRLVEKSKDTQAKYYSANEILTAQPDSEDLDSDLVQRYAATLSFSNASKNNKNITVYKNKVLGNPPVISYK